MVGSRRFFGAQSPLNFRVARIPLGLEGIVFLLDFADGSLTRASEAAFVDPRLPVSGGTGDYAWDFVETGLVVLEQSGLDVDTSWIKQTTGAGTPVVTEGQTDPWGGTTASAVEDDDAAGFESVKYTFSLAAVIGAPITSTWYVEKITSATHFVELQHLAGSSCHVDVNLDSGASTVRVGAGDVTVSEEVTGWWRVDVTWTPTTTANPSLTFGPAFGTTYPSVTSAATGSTTFVPPTLSGEQAWKRPDEARIFSDGAVLIEASGTNVVQYDRAISTSPWAAVGSPTFDLDSDPGPDGSGLADTIQHAASPNSRTVQDLTGPADAETWVYSVYTKHPSTPKDWRLQVIGRDGGAKVNTNQTTVAEWERIESAAHDVGTGASAVQVRLTNDGVGIAGDVDHVHTQYENAAFVSSPIRTVGGAGTRNKDDMRFSAGTWGAAGSELVAGKFSFYWVPTFDSDDGIVPGQTHTFYHTTTASRYAQIRYSGTLWQFYLGNSAGITVHSMVTGAAQWVAGDLFFFDFDHVTGDIEVTKNGVDVVNARGALNAAGGSWDTSEVLFVGQNNGAANNIRGVMTRPVRV